MSSQIGRIVGLPTRSEWATIRDEYGNNRTVSRKHLEKDARVGEDYAYHVSFFNASGAQTLTPADKEDTHDH